MTFNSHKCPNTKSDVISHRSQAAALRALNQTLLFKGAMIHFNAPRAFSLRFPLRVSHLVKTRRPVFRCAVCGANPKYFDFSETFEPADCPVSATQSGFGDSLNPAAANSDLPVRFQAGQKMPAQRTTQFQILNRSIPTVEANQFGIKTALKCLKQHLGKMVVLGFSVAVLIKNTVINRDAANTVGPEQSNQIDSINEKAF